MTRASLWESEVTGGGVVRASTGACGLPWALIGFGERVAASVLEQQLPFDQPRTEIFAMPAMHACGNATRAALLTRIVAMTDV
jgi:hypothetical protein